ncbi:MAG: InlB B-repeat-containing protein [Fibrobacterota bacterium]
MRLLILCVLFIFSVFSSVLSSENLLFVEKGSPAAATVSDSYRIVEMVNDGYLVMASKQQLSETGVRLMDAEPQGREYYLVYPYGETPGDPVEYDPAFFEDYGRVIETFPEALLMETDAQRLAEIQEYSIQMVYVDTQNSFDLTGSHTIVEDWHLEPAQYNPLIEEMMGRIDSDSVDQFMQDLTSIYNRDATARWNRDEMVPYLRDKLLEYGCDTIIIIPLRGYEGSLVAGVRYGTKTPSLEKFTLVGGHPDTRNSREGSNARHQGANDNTTGTVAFLEAARVHQHYEFDNTIIYAGFNAEEYGLHGSKALMNELRGMGAQVVGGCFSFDMFGMTGSSLDIRYYDGIEGAPAFNQKLRELNDLYNGYARLNATTTTTPPTDIRHIWGQGYVGVYNNFLMGGSGSIHTPEDSINSNYNPVHIANSCRLGIAGTAFYAVPATIGTFYDLTVNAENGTVDTDPDGSSFEEGTEVAVTAQADYGYDFSHWSGDVSGSENPQTITMDSDKDVTANFEKAVTYSLDISASNGSVSISPDYSEYVEGEDVELRVHPDSNYVFSGWEGDISGDEGAVTIRMDADKSVQATFTAHGYESLNQSHLSIASVSSEDDYGDGRPAEHVLDGDNSTAWFTHWEDPAEEHPHEIVLAVDTAAAVGGLRYTPRQESENGRINAYEVYVSADGEEWGGPAAAGFFQNSEDVQDGAFIPARTDISFIRLVALSEVNDEVWASVAELDVLYDPEVSIVGTQGTLPEVTLHGSVLQITQDTPLTVQISSVSGRRLKTINTTGPQAINLRDMGLSSGVYVLHIDGASGENLMTAQVYIR